MKKKILKTSKKALAIALATVMAIPTVVMTNPVEAEAANFENPETMDCTSWWTNFTTGYAVGNEGTNISWNYQANEGATANYHAPTIVVFSSDDGTVDGANYECYAIIRADLYAVANGNWSYGSHTEDWTNLGFKKTDIYGPAVDNAEDDEADTDAFEWKDWVADNTTGLKNANVAAKKVGNYVEIAYNVNGVKGLYDIPVTSGKDVYISVTGENCVLSNFETSEYSDTVEAHNGVWWGAKTAGYTVGDDGLKLTFENKTDEAAVDNWEAPYLILYQGSENLVNGNGYTEVGVIRSDFYGWGTDYAIERTVEPDWDTFLSNLKQGGVSYEADVEVDGTQALVELRTQDSTANYTFTIDPAKELYVTVMAQNCAITNIKEVDTNEEVLTLLGAQYNEETATESSYDLGFVTTIDKATFESLDIKEMGVIVKNNVTLTDLALITSNAGDAVKKITTNYVTEISNLDDTQNNEDVYAFRSIITGVSNLYKNYIAVPYVTYIEGEEEVTVYGDAVTRCVYDCK